MGDFLGSVWWLIVALGLLVTFHEYGHFWVARRCGVKVLRFSVGFGTPIFSRTGKDGTEYVVAALPLGGYVKMLDERESDVGPDEVSQAFNNKTLGQRSAIIAAGPIFNLAFALLAFWLMFMVGVQEFRMLLGEPQGIAQSAGLQAGDEIVAVGERPTRSLTHANLELLGYGIDRKPVEVTVEDAGGERRQHVLDFSQLPDDFKEEKLLETAGLTIYSPRGRPFVDRLVEGDPAEQGGMRVGDLIISVNGSAVEQARDLSEAIQAHADGLNPLEILVERDGRQVTLMIMPQASSDGGEQRYVIGVYPFDPEDRRFFTIMRLGPLESIGAAFSESYRITGATLGLIVRMVSGSASLSNLSGPISIAQYARDSARLGLSRFLFFLGVLSLSLAILNFLPIPLLDGGHLAYYLVEWVTGKPVSEHVQIIGQYVGLSLLIALMGLTFYNDILRLVS
ncbi:MAG: RIP metalloprotease RseP [Xanthomonadales bacterium]|nr:RIP metalloprotease RseP [Xanthomonadales bacterium]